MYREQLNPAPIPANEVTTGQFQVYDDWEFSAESYNARRSMRLLIKRMDTHIPTYN